MPKKMIHTLEELKDLQALPLDFKVALKFCEVDEEFKEKFKIANRKHEDKK